MEIIKFTKEDIHTKYSACSNLKEIIRRFEDELKVKGQVLCSIRVNGMVFDEKDEAKFAEAQKNDIQNIEFGTSEPNALVHESTLAIREYIERLKSSCENAADLFRSQKPQEAWSYFTEVTQGHEHLMEALMALKPNIVRLRGQEILEPWKTAEIHMMHTVRELLNSYEARDFVLLSDILEYELYNALEKWDELLRY